jgi:hypothetical protein
MSQLQASKKDPAIFNEVGIMGAPFQAIEALARPGGYPAKKRGFPILLRSLWSFEQGK